MVRQTFILCKFCADMNAPDGIEVLPEDRFSSYRLQVGNIRGLQGHILARADDGGHLTGDWRAVFWLCGPYSREIFCQSNLHGPQPRPPKVTDDGLYCPQPASSPSRTAPVIWLFSIPMGFKLCGQEISASVPMPVLFFFQSGGHYRPFMQRPLSPLRAASRGWRGTSSHIRASKLGYCDQLYQTIPGGQDLEALSWRPARRWPRGRRQGQEAFHAVRRSGWVSFWEE